MDRGRTALCITPNQFACIVVSSLARDFSSFCFNCLSLGEGLVNQ